MVGYLYQSPSPHCRPDTTVPHDSGSSVRNYMMQQHPTPKAETPYIEPEIIPPGADWPRSSRIWVSTGPCHTTRVQITRLGPIGIALFVLLIGILASVGLFYCSEPPWSELSQQACSLAGGSSPASCAVHFGDSDEAPGSVRNVVFGRTGTQMPEWVAHEEEGRADVRPAAHLSTPNGRAPLL